MVDFGYDIEDFYSIDSMFGTMEDLKELFREAKKRNIKILLDLVLNHSSDKCEWFKKSVKREPGYEDLYLWANGKNNNTEPPNNWLSVFYGPAWEFNEERNQWYLHQYGKFFFHSKKVESVSILKMVFFSQGTARFQLP